MGVLVQQHGAQVAMAQADLTLLCNRAGDGESFQAFADGSSAVSSALQAALDSDGGAQGVSPDSVIEADGLDAADDLVAVDALGQAASRCRRPRLSRPLAFRQASILGIRRFWDSKVAIIYVPPSLILHAGRCT